MRSSKSQHELLRYWLCALPLSIFADPAAYSGVAFPDIGSDGLPLDTIDNFEEFSRRAGFRYRYNVAKRAVEVRYRRGPWRRIDGLGKNLVLALRHPFNPKALRRAR